MGLGQGGAIERTDCGRGAGIGGGNGVVGSPLKFHHLGSEAPPRCLSKEPLFLRLHQRGLDWPEELTVGLGARQRGLVGRSCLQGAEEEGDSHLPLFPEEFMAMLGVGVCVCRHPWRGGGRGRLRVFCSPAP